MSEVQQLLGEISQCPVAREIRLGNSTSSCACRQIVGVQTGADFQVPEPWSGQIDIAPLLFISSNPSIDEHEDYPYRSWESSRTADFFSNRFARSSGWVKDGFIPARLMAPGAKIGYVSGRPLGAAHARSCRGRSSRQWTLL